MRAALAQKLRDGALVVVDELSATENKTKPAAELLKRLGADRQGAGARREARENSALRVRNIAGVPFAERPVAARDVMNTSRMIATRAAVET